VYFIKCPEKGQKVMGLKFEEEASESVSPGQTVVEKPKTCHIYTNLRDMFLAEGIQPRLCIYNNKEICLYSDDKNFPRCLLLGWEKSKRFPPYCIRARKQGGAKTERRRR